MYGNLQPQNSNTRSCAKMELIESYGLTVADINNLVRHAISAADNDHPYSLSNQLLTGTSSQFGQQSERAACNDKNA